MASAAPEPIPKRVVATAIATSYVSPYQKNVPYSQPTMVDKTTTKSTYVDVLFVPMMLRITSMFGRLKAGPAKRSARAGPFPIPLPMSP